MFGRIRARREEIRQVREIQCWQAHVQAQSGAAPVASEPAKQPAPAAQQPQAVVDDFLPADWRVPSREEIAGMMMPWDTPLVIDDEVRACPQCGNYRNWVILSTRDQVWLRCRDGHETLEPRLDTAWYNRSSGPMERSHPTLEEGLKYLGH
ncbi:hypothetical protein [Streptomyces sp. NPDC093589]|uniref:hypothetical protein n=1 Tax=Streptomyces sp. NPDC093589 TaxID=3366043 RepID=UPI0038119C92